jgi:hypothetical protein
MNSKRAIGQQPLNSQSNVLWWGNISVGTPPVQYTVDFDTGSSDFFLPAKNCDTSCEGHTRYDPSASSTSLDRGSPFNLAYNDGTSVSGEQYSDTVTISGLTAIGQAVGAATNYSQDFDISNFPPDGLLGMAFPNIGQYDAPPLIQSLIAQNQMDSPVFAMKLVVNDSELSVGGLESNLYTGDVTYIPIDTPGYWQVTFDALKVGETEVTGSNSCLIDSVCSHYYFLTRLG